MTVEEIFAYLEANHLTIATAESCTGGLLGATLTDLPGISAVYKYGVITYSNEAKMKLLQVPEETLARVGAVSRETAEAMARGLASLSGADFCLSVTGIAGPEGGSSAKPVGLVYIALAHPGGLVCQKNIFAGDRQAVRQQSVATALAMVTAAIGGR